MRSNKLREVVKSALETIKDQNNITDIYYQNADSRALYPHVVFTMTGSNMLDFNRKDYTIDIDVWTRSEVEAENIADDIEDLFVYRNSPTNLILPTFYLVTRLTAEDEDKDIRHIVIRMESQMYDNE